MEPTRYHEKNPVSYLIRASHRMDTIKLAVRIEVLKTQVRLHLPKAMPDQAIFSLLLTRMPRLSL